MELEPGPMKKLSTVAQHGVVKPTAKKRQKKESYTTSRGCTSQQQREVVSNVLLNDNTNTKEISKEMVEWYITTLDLQLGTRAGFRWDDRQQAIVEDIASTGVTLDQWKREIVKSIRWFKKEERSPPTSLAFYKDAFNNRR